MAREGGRRPGASHETSDPLLKEAQDQTRALMRLQAYKRLAYSLVAIGVILVWWGLVGGSSRAAGVAGVVLVAIGVPSSAVLYVGIKHGKQNVENMLFDYEVQHAGRPSTREEIDSQIMGETPRAIERAIDAANRRSEGRTHKRRKAGGR
ncbi:MAG: hypothetical protein PUE38_08710 [Olsenella sp.]|uniref:PrgI family protein n=1 Tax=Olsenella absiana TaxID=3115222 RepID=A0ABU7R7C5_9ACTN|nr:hypothetical protein [Olsenella sp.]